MNALNFFVISGDSKAAVHCPTQEDAKFFLKHLAKEYPSKHFNYGDNWGVYKENTCYWPNFGVDHEGLQYGDLSYAKRGGVQCL